MVFKNSCGSGRKSFFQKNTGYRYFCYYDTGTLDKAFQEGIIDSEGIFFQGLQNSNDVYFTLTALAAAEKITCVEEDLVFYRVGAEESLQGSKEFSPVCFFGSVLRCV